jgi:hypothetical protein
LLFAFLPLEIKTKPNGISIDPRTNNWTKRLTSVLFASRYEYPKNCGWVMSIGIDNANRIAPVPESAMPTNIELFMIDCCYETALTLL